MAARSASPQRPLDRFDRAILRIVQRDARTPQRTIAEAVNLSAATVQRRIAAMEASGVIRGNIALVDPKALPLTITAIVEVYLQDERAETVQSAKARFQSEPEVQQCYYVTGGTSFILIVVTTDMTAYQALTQRLFEENDSVNRFRSLIALDRVKTDASLIIP